VGSVIYIITQLAGKIPTYIPLIVLADWVIIREPETAIDWGGLVGMVFLLATKNTPWKD